MRLSPSLNSVYHHEFIFAYTFSTFEVVTVVFLIAMMVSWVSEKFRSLSSCDRNHLVLKPRIPHILTCASAIEGERKMMQMLSVVDPRFILMVLLGSVAGLFVGAIPGLSVSMATALLVSITYTWEHSDAWR